MLSPQASRTILSWEKTRSTEQLEICVSTNNLKACLKYLKSSLLIVLNFASARKNLMFQFSFFLSTSYLKIIKYFEVPIYSCFMIV